MNKKPLIIGIGVAAAVCGWALFRPELLFVNKEVHETLPMNGTQKMAEVLAKGTFTSQAHETTGSAEVVELEGKQYLRLNGFSTSNGPDVRVYITEGDKPGKESLALGSLKGNKGDQVYQLPNTFHLGAKNSVAIWCERFAVGFGKADLTAETSKMSFAASGFHLAGFSDRTEVTFGSVMGDPRSAGRAALVEQDGKRFAELSFSKLQKNTKLRLVKQEKLSKGAFPVSVKYIDLNAPKAVMGKYQSSTPLNKEIDLWLYRSVAIIDTKTNMVVSYVNLRSAQEKPATIFFA